MSEHATADHSRTDSRTTFAAAVDAGPLAAAVDALDALVEECVVHAGPDGLAVAAQDPATVALASLELPADAFERYDADGAALGVDLERFGDVLGMAGADEAVSLSLDPETRTLDVRVGDLAYTLGLVDPDAIRSPPDDVDYEDHLTATVTLPGADLTHAVRAADMVADHCALGVDADAGHLYASADGDVDSVRVEHDAADCQRFEAGPAHSLYSVSYLDAMARVVPVDAPVTVRLGPRAVVPAGRRRRDVLPRAPAGRAVSARRRRVPPPAARGEVQALYRWNHSWGQ